MNNYQSSLIEDSFGPQKKEGKLQDKQRGHQVENQTSECVEAKNARICGVEYQYRRGPILVSCILASPVIFIHWE